jgi:uncharacterized protein (DUF58 family)
MLSLIALSGVLSEMGIQRLQVERRLAGRVYAGRPARGTWIAGNPRRYFPSLGVRLDELVGNDAELEVASAPTLPWVPPGATEERRGTWTFARRGLHRLHGIRVSTTWPFGILRKWYDVRVPLEVLVLPSPGPAASPLGAGLRGVGDPTPRSRGAGDFMGLREHRVGEGLRSIHWRSTARLRRRMVAERAADAMPRLFVRIEYPVAGGSAERADAFERCLSEAVGTLLKAEAEGAQIVVELPGSAPRTLDSAQERDAFLRSLALMRLPGTS